jgi:phosphate acetyltransferase
MLTETSNRYNSTIAGLRRQAFSCEERIVLTDGADARVLAAVCTIVERSAIRPVLIGQASLLLPQLRKLKIQSRVDVYDPGNDPRQPYLVELLRARFSARGKTAPAAEVLTTLASEPVYCGMLLVQAEMADGLLGGAATPTANVIRAAIQVIGVNPEYPIVSGAFAMLLRERLPAGQDVLFFCDTAVIPNPDAKQLASIAMTTARTAQVLLKEEPVIALLSFSSYGSAEDASVDKVRTALRLLREQAPNLRVDGELQADAALIPEISQRKAPGNSVQGQANILVFPNLDASNIAYKLVERISGAMALGVLLSGLTKPVNDLSRGCSSDDIINMVAVTALQATLQRATSMTRSELSA